MFDLSAGVGGLGQRSPASPEHTPDSRSMQSVDLEVDLEVELETSASLVVRDIPAVSSGVFLTSQSDLRTQILNRRQQRNKLFTEIKRESREMIYNYDNLTTADDC